LRAALTPLALTRDSGGRHPTDVECFAALRR
jgi:hypothetical protein